MPRKRMHQTDAARQKAYRADKARYDFVTNTSVGGTIDELAAMYGATKNEVLNDLVKFALTNRDWKRQGLLWTAHRGTPPAGSEPQQ